MKIAVLYQAASVPSKDGILKPVKEGGYSDSGADIAFCLRKGGMEVVLPVEEPDERKNLDWVFPDTQPGIEEALSKGADTLWLNTTLFGGHPIESFRGKGIWVVGQDPQEMDFYDNKYKVNRFLASHGIPVAEQSIAQLGTAYNGTFPCVIKPIRGRGSQGVEVAFSEEDYQNILRQDMQSGKYGKYMMAEPYLPGREITLSVLPGGECLPVVERFHHRNGIIPYSGEVPVSENSKAIPTEPEMQLFCQCCSDAARLLKTKALIRIDGRQDQKGNFQMFDVNVKPNMTGSSRVHRQGQDSLSLLAARHQGLNYFEFLQKLLSFSWKI